MINLKFTSAAVALLLAFISTPSAWDGYDSESGSPVVIEKGNLVREGKEIEYYDYADNEYKNVEVENIERNGSTVSIEVYDYESGEYRVLEMDDN